MKPLFHLKNLTSHSILLLLVSTHIACGEVSKTELDSPRLTLESPETIDWNNNPGRIMGELETITTFGHSDLPSKGIADKVPYPGNWWPLRNGGINQRWDGNNFSPAEKYDRVYKNWTPDDNYLSLKTFEAPGTQEGWQDELDKWYNAMGPTARAEIDQSNKRAFDKEDNDGDDQVDESDDWDGLESWFGHCNGWAAAAISVDEPVHPAYVTAPDGKVIKYEISDVKALLSDSYYSVGAGFLSRRCNRRPDDCADRTEVSCKGAPHCTWSSTPATEDQAQCEAIDAYTWTTDEYGRVEATECRDTNPASLYIITTNYLGRHKKAYVIDATHDWQVWNFPVYKYAIDQEVTKEVTQSEANVLLGRDGEASYPYNGNAKKFAYVKMTIWYVSDGIAPNKRPVGHLVSSYDHNQTLEFILELSETNEIIGGEWVGESRTNHPDFVWVPVGTPYGNNPEMSWDNIEAIHAKSRSGVAQKKNISLSGTTSGILDTVNVENAETTANQVELFVDVEGTGAYTFTLTNPDGQSVTVQKNGSDKLIGWWPYDFGSHTLATLATGTLNGAWTLNVTGATQINSWAVSVWELVEDHGNNAENATVVDAGNHDGTIDFSNDTDWFAINLQAGAEVSAETELVTITDTKLFMYGTDGTTLLAENDDIANGNYASKIVHQVTEAGTYYFKVTAYSANQTGSYKLNLTVVNPDNDSDDSTDDCESDSNTSGFNWGCACQDGGGDFEQPIENKATVVVGDIPAGKANVRIELSNDTDVDVQLVDKETGFELIAWPGGRLKGPTEECTTYEGVEYCYSGYNGDCGSMNPATSSCSRGNEWIEIRGETNRVMTMRAYGYAAGNALVEYTFEAPADCVDSGNGSFNQEIVRGGIVTVGTIPQGKENIEIKLTAQNDIDVQIWDGETKIVVWDSSGNHGLLNQPGEQWLCYPAGDKASSAAELDCPQDNMLVGYSGYNGDQTLTGKGNEWIKIIGAVTNELTMKAFGYAAGDALVEYRWGVSSEELQ